MQKISLIFLFLTAFSAKANYVGSSLTEIVSIISYNQYGDGDVIFRLKKTMPPCTGYWLTKSDAGFQANLSMLVSAFQAKTQVKVYGSPALKWKGSSGVYCKLYSLQYHQ